MKVCLLGPPGAGKGTQARQIATRFSIPHVSTGDILRAHVARGTPLGRKATEVVRTGGMLADELICELLADRLKDDDCRRGYVLDGVPRTLAQAHCLDASGDGVDVAVALLVSDGETATRIAERLFDPVSFSTYHPRHVPAPASVVHRLIRRTDDTSETHVRRLQEFRQHFDDICTYYENRGILRRVSGDGLPEEIAGEIVSIITDLR